MLQPTSFVLLFSVILPLTTSQFVSSLPQCIQNCIDQSSDNLCSLTDIKCICRASAGNFLPDVITCMHGNCDNNLDRNLLLTPLQLVCQIAGTPIPASAIRNAENQASSLATMATTTVTVGASSESGSGSAVTTTEENYRVSTTTVTTTQSGSTIYQVIPLTIGSKTTISGSPSTVTSLITTTATPSYTGLIPVIIVGTDSDGNTYTSTTTQAGTIRTLTTTDSKGSTITAKSTLTSPSSSASTRNSNSDSNSGSSVGSTVTSTATSAAAQQTSSSESRSRTSTAVNPDETNSAPFKDTNGAASRIEVGRWWVLVALGVVGFVGVMC